MRWIEVFLFVVYVDFINANGPKLVGVRVEDLSSVSASKGSVLCPGHIFLRLLGDGLDLVHSILMTPLSNACLAANANSVMTPLEQNNEMVLLKWAVEKSGGPYFVCFQSVASHKGNFTFSPANLGHQLSEFTFQGNKSYQSFSIDCNESTVEVAVRTYFLPLSLEIVLVIFLLILSGLFSGLNLGLMSLHPSELSIIMKSGSKREKKYASIIYPIRLKGNYLLCSILYGNVLVNSAIAILFDDLTSGLVALLVSSLGIVIFGEILPQTACSRYGLLVGSRTILITKFLMLITAPLSWPTSRILDYFFGHEMRDVYSKERLFELIKLTCGNKQAGLTKSEVAVFTGAIIYSQRAVKDIMTPIKEVFMIAYNSILDSATVSAIVESGYTRIPVYDVSRDNIMSILNVKDLVLLDPEDCVPLKTDNFICTFQVQSLDKHYYCVCKYLHSRAVLFTSDLISVCQYYKYAVRHVLEDTPLQVMLDEFKDGAYHMAFVNRITDDSERDPYYELVGIVTLEDIIEEILQSEIVDETERRLMRQKVRQPNKLISNEFASGAIRFTCPSTMITATVQFLSTSLPQFGAEHISTSVLQKLIQQNVVQMRADRESPRLGKGRAGRQYREQREEQNAGKYLYTKSKPADYFIMILEGRVTVEMGADNFSFETGPFFYFGKQVLEKVLKSIAGVKKKQEAATSANQLLQNAENLASGFTGSEADSGPKLYAELSANASFVPDFSVRVDVDVVYFLLKASVYLQAYRATLIERSSSGNGLTSQNQNRSASQSHLATASSLSLLKVPPAESVPGFGSGSNSGSSIDNEFQRSVSSNPEQLSNISIRPSDLEKPIGLVKPQHVLLQASRLHEQVPLLSLVSCTTAVSDTVDNSYSCPQFVDSSQQSHDAEYNETTAGYATSPGTPTGSLAETCTFSLPTVEARSPEDGGSLEDLRMSSPDGADGGVGGEGGVITKTGSFQSLYQRSDSALLAYENEELREMNDMVLEKRLKLVNKPASVCADLAKYGDK